MIWTSIISIKINGQVIYTRDNNPNLKDPSLKTPEDKIKEITNIHNIDAT